jgi:hypothetical protein
MDDYFSSFIRQTGVSIKSDTQPKDHSPQKSSSEFGGKDAIAPIEVEEIKGIGPGSEKFAEDRADQTRKGTELGPKTLGSEPFARGDPNETAATDQPLHGMFPAGLGSEGNMRNTLLPEPEQTQFRAQVNPDGDSSRTDGATKGILPFEVTMESEAAEAKADGPLRHSPASEAPLLDDPAPTRTRTALDQGMSHEQIKQSVLKEVRRWVTSQPVFSTEEQRSQVTTKVAEAVEQTLQKASGKGQTRGQGRTEKSRAGEPDTAVHDLHLSIGPLNITVEQPDTTTQHPKPQPRREAKAAPDSGTSRLRRHYIRI